MLARLITARAGSRCWVPVHLWISINGGHVHIVSFRLCRIGFRGLPVLAVLICALVLAAIAWGVAEIYGEAAKTPATEEKPAPQENSQ
ncbi:MAG: hypothetical protein E5V94_04170, partial [Mesorhizobium sp.]